MVKMCVGDEETSIIGERNNHDEDERPVEGRVTLTAGGR